MSKPIHDYTFEELALKYLEAEKILARKPCKHKRETSVVLMKQGTKTKWCNDCGSLFFYGRWMRPHDLTRQEHNDNNRFSVEPATQP